MDYARGTEADDLLNLGPCDRTSSLFPGLTLHQVTRLKVQASQMSIVNPSDHAYIPATSTLARGKPSAKWHLQTSEDIEIDPERRVTSNVSLWQNVTCSHSAPKEAAGYRLIGRAAQDHLIELNVGLRQAGRDELMRLVDQGGDWYTLEVTVEQANVLLEADYSEYLHEEINAIVVRTARWSVPPRLADHIDTIQPTDSFLWAQPSSMNSRDRRGNSHESAVVDEPEKVESLNQVATGLSEQEMSELMALDQLPNGSAEQVCNASAVTSTCIGKLYGTFDYEVKAAERNSMGIVNFAGEFNNRSDIQIFFEKFRPDAAQAGAATSFGTINIDGAINQQTPASPDQLKHKQGREGNMDAQVQMGVAFPTPFIAYSVAGISPAFHPDEYTPTNTNEPFLKWLHYILALENLPNVISISYGDIEQTVPYDYAKRICDSFAQLGARGVTVIFGAGDSGVGKPGYCQSNNGSEAFEFLTSFPASCPYGTSVGATRGVGSQETVAYNDRNGFVSGGGFSKYFSRPEYQHKSGVVDAYLNGSFGEGQYSGLYNAGGRGYPDVAVNGYRRAMVWNGNTYLVDGTSVSAPTFAGIVALVNDALIAEGKPTLGFLNPWLYSAGFEAFRDMTMGSTKGCDTDGFPASKGWDPASGFGTPWFPRFKELALARRSREQRPWYWNMQ
ncbi:Tripeptidyl-peptidase sed3 [Lecanosticta acicola]|uniref:tripeptidyl-peptidase II n=1 Tax=Lecanosticta acicola TaxID=111012 RepID=A0AAI9EET2_9PEZI|nr:Tripeptidyl-peptidase sed3 [Lecanosticta acicola]